MRLRLDQEAASLQIGEDALARLEAVEARVRTDRDVRARDRARRGR